MTDGEIAVLYARAGSLGHAVLAENYTSLLRENGRRVWSADMTALDPGFAVDGFRWAYWTVMRHAPWLWRFLHHHWPRLPLLAAFRHYFLPRHFANTAAMLMERKPDVVVSTQPFSAALVARLKRKRRIHTRLVAAISDWVLQPYWQFPEIDHYFVPLAEQCHQLVSMGVRRERVTVTGLLVAPGYRRSGAIRNGSVPTVLVMGGGIGWRLEDQIRSLASVRIPMECVVFCGSRLEEMRRVLNRLDPPAVKFRLLDYTVDPVPYFARADLLISKPGGLTPAQAFACGVPLLCVDPLPGAEEESLEVLVRAGAVVVRKPGQDLGSRVQEQLADPQTLHQTARRASALMPADCAERILAEL